MPRTSSTAVRSLVLLSTGLVLIALLASRGLAQDPASPDRAYHQAYQLYESELFDAAAESFRTFRTRYPTHPRSRQALYYQGRALLAAGQADVAIPLLEQFADRYPAHPLTVEAQFRLGQHYHRQEEYAAAESAFEFVLERTPPADLDARTRYWLGETLLAQNSHAEGLEALNQVADRHPEHSFAPRALYAIGYHHAGRENYDQAARTFERLSVRYPDTPFARNTQLALGEAYYELGNYERAIEELDAALPALSGSEKERANFLLAEAHNQLENHEDAIVFYRRFTESNTESPYYRRALYGLAWNYHNEGVYEWAAERFARVRENARDSLAHRAMYYEAVNLKLAGQPETALTRFEGVLSLWPEGPLSDHALYEKGITHYQQREWQESAEAFRELVETYPGSEKLGDGLRMLGEAHVAMGEFTRALEAYDAAIEREAAPPSLRHEVLFQKAWLLYRGNRYGEAAPAFLSLYDQDPERSLAADALFWGAESHYQAGRYDQAAELFQSYLEQYSAADKVDAAHYALGWVYFKAGRYQAAARHFQTFLRTYRAESNVVPYESDARLRLADSYFALNQYPEAIQQYRQVSGEGTDYAIFQIGKARYYAGNHYEAINEFERLLKAYPYSRWREEAQYLLGYIYFENEDYEQAIGEFEELIQRYPDHPLAARAQYTIGDALYNQGRYGQSEEAYQQVMQQFPDSEFVVDAVTGTQYAMVARGRSDSLQAVVDSFAADHPESERLDEIRFRQAEVQFQNGSLKEAISSFQRFVRTAEDRDLLVEAYLYLGRAYADLEQPQEAAGYLRQILNGFPETDQAVEAGQRLADLYQQEENYGAALEVHRRLSELRPDSTRLLAESRYGEGVALLQLERTDEAASTFQEAIEAAPDSAAALPARLGLARVYEQRGQTDRALTQYRTVARQGTGETGAEAQTRLGELLLRQDRPNEALEALSRVSVLYPGYRSWIARSYLYQARAHRSLGNTGEANRLYDRVIEDFADTPYSDQASTEKNQLSAAQ